MTNLDDRMPAMPGDKSDGHASWEQLNDLVDNRLNAEEAEGVELHLAECAVCAAQRAALIALSGSAAGLVAAVPPPDDLWNDVVASIGAGRSTRPNEAEPQTTSLTPASTPPLRPLRSPRTLRSNAVQTPSSARMPATTRAWLAAAAVLLMALSSGLTALYMRRAGNDAATIIAHTKPQPAPAGTTLLPAAFVETERTYLASVAEVQSLLDAQRGVLAPATIETVDRALATIDAAIAEARAALLADPANRALTELLETNYRQKLDLLRRTAALHQTS